MESKEIFNTVTTDDPYGFKLQSDSPVKILVINCCSSSLKYTLFDTAAEKPVANGQVERIGTGTDMVIEYEANHIELKKDLPSGDHKAAFDAIITELSDSGHGVIESPAEIAAVGHDSTH